MKIEDQVCSLELATQLKELGVKQKSFFYWWVLQDEKPELIWDLTIKKPKYISAFTTAELGEILQQNKNIRLDSTKSSDGWSIAVSVTYRIYAATEADCRAKLIIYLAKNLWTKTK